MSSVRFVMTDISPDITCPNCGQGLDIDEWRHTEYGEPQHGKSIETCCNCGSDFVLQTEILVNYSVV